ncbi:ABC transporter ATP-binding protein [Methyloprofundus sedimenti]|uniref:ABC transporter ATP-binding protein n=1 Tax=Methyloprofundus sedimenti TaxID=1420851 RepID=A0A1V8M8B9_9GAMM|nr:ATP-binding cassette domain-containing protein [Methyloprofundus sedimenti]OQK17797.1 ABC transporter ATP-binding protein [Methyloprofundus sedimenti]
MMPLLEIRHVTFTADNKTVLDNLDLNIQEAEIHALIGTNGTGKSTLARLIMGCEGYHINYGEIFFAQQKIDQYSLQKRANLGISMVWQEPAYFEGISVRNYLSLNKQAELTQCLLSVGLSADDYLDRMLDKTMSGGERKRIELASMLALRPRLCILDEPVSGIDLLTIKNIISVIKQIQLQGSTVLLISHREEIASVADKASLLCGGKVILTGTPEKVIHSYKSRSCIICDGRECNHVNI